MSGPFHLIVGETKCWKCGARAKVGAIICHRVLDDAYDEEATLKYIEWLPSALFAEVRESLPNYELRSTAGAGRAYYSNVCACGVVIGDHYIHQPDEVFFPMTDEARDSIDVRRLRFVDSFSTRADPSWGEAERLLAR